MKKALAIFLTLILMTTLIACGKQATVPSTTQEPTLAQRDESMPKKLLQADVADLPIGNNDMTYEQRRQLCLDFMELQVTAQWKPGTDVKFQMTNYNKGSLKELLTSEIYGGIIYHSKGFGNIYRWLEYYDETTGVMDMERALRENGGIGEDAAITDAEYDANGNITYKKYRSLMTFGNQCTSSTCWSWGRVINSVAFGDTCDLTVYNGYIPVGCYTYGYEYEGKTYDALTIREFGIKSDTNPLGYDTKDVIEDWNNENGSNAMYQCYAQLKPGDCLVSDGHALMVKSIYFCADSSGHVDPDMSIVVVQEQIEGWGKEGDIQGVPFKQQGRDTCSYSFKYLQNKFYIPFTFAELLDPNDPQDKQHLDYYNTYKDQISGVNALYNTFTFSEEAHSEQVEKAVTYCTADGDSITAAEVENLVVGSNYSISDMFVTVTDKNGQELLKNIWRADFSNYREVSLGDHKSSWERDTNGDLIPVSDGIQALANGENTITVTLQLSTGEKLTAYQGTLKP